MKYSKLYSCIFIILLTVFSGNAQVAKIISLDDANALALQNSRLLKIKELQVSEKQAKVSEDKVKYFPVATVNSTFQYNGALAELTIPKGMFGTLPLPPTPIALPSKDETFALSEHNNFNAGAVVYQPITQLGKIYAGVSISKKDAEVANMEFVKAKMQIKQAVEKLYYGILITEKQKLESEFKVAMLEKKLKDIESAYDAGKALEGNKLGIMASLADEEQTSLKLDIQLENYRSEFQILTGIESGDYSLKDVSVEISELGAQVVDSTILEKNIDIQIASLIQQKAKFGVKAAHFSFLPDFGVMAGYSYQLGSNLYPSNNPFVGATLKWNLSDIASNSYTTRQRRLQLLQANENRQNVEENAFRDFQKVERNLRQSIKLIQVAQKVVDYRIQDLEIQQNRQAAGTILQTDLLSAKASLAKAQSDLLAAQLSYSLAISDKKILKGEY